MSVSRRRLLAGLGAGAVAPGILRGDHTQDGRSDITPVVAPSGRGLDEVARDERFWTTVANQYPVTPQVINLENGYYGIMSAPVRREYLRNMDRLNQLNSYLLRTTYKAELEHIRERLAAAAGVSAEEVTLTRGGTEALQNLIAGYNRLRPGDAVMYADLDYHSCQYAVNALRHRRGVEIVRIVIPEPPTRQAVLDTYSRALRDHPGVRLLLLSHMNNRTGLVVPVREIVAMARERDVDVIVDAAHSWGQLDFTIPDLDAEFAGFSLHKWINAPLGVGFLYVRKNRLADIDAAFADETYPAGDIRSRVHSGTLDVAAFLTLPTALDCHEALGASVKEARLRYLRNRWVDQVRQIDNLEILTPDDSSMYGAITSFRLSGRTSQADNEAIAGYLLDTYRIFTVRRGGVTGGDCVRVTPAQFTPAGHVDQLATALHDVARRFRV
ncbi:aminotransferase class V-fold PLP-dependent enzyme [Nocardia sp. NBC_00881]|uniref:aminotransferase class V-fold PLP-dependent enzyme n=1 Tax=Nocardia sp. NBC_00881 TaxID=2975995 RepID=UPI00386503EB|nr:aminotransferase class V-fold PLP-dependent enzyme [Nocardia sp. NBC_00881]